MTTRPRSSSARRAAGSAPVASRLDAQKDRPTTAASWSVRFSSGGRASTRAASTARTVVGSGSSPVARTPRSRRWLAISSAKKGLPSARATTRSCIAGGAPGRSSDTSRRASSSVSGSSESCEAARRPPQPGRASSSAGRAVTTMSSGPVERATSCSSMSSSAGSAQCRSSTTRTAPPWAASPVASLGHARETSAATDSGSIASSGLPGRVMPAVMARADTVRSGSGETRSTSRRSFSPAAAALSWSRMPAADHSSSRSGQYVRPSP